VRPDIPASCAARPVHGGLVVPWAQVVLADGAPDFLAPHHAKTERCWAEGRCQIHGGLLDRPCIVAGGPLQMAELHFDEAPLCIPCALYSSRACPMLGGRRLAYTRHDKISNGPRGQVCPQHGAGCDCGGWTETNPGLGGHGGEPAHDYYACYVTPGQWQLTGTWVERRCPDKHCKRVHRRLVTNGAYLTAPPAKIIHVSAPGQGRLWARLDADQVAGLVTRPWYADPQAQAETVFA
jgi:hypothetical protein